MSDRRRPAWLYGNGEEPDPRFTLANERTLLAWVRTSVAFAAAGLAVLVADELFGRWAAAVSATGFALALVVVAGALIRWARTERALRGGTGLPAPWLAVGVVAVLIVAALVGIVAAISAPR